MVKEVFDMVEKQKAKPVINKQGCPVWGYCPTCEKVVTKSNSPNGCKHCLQRLMWED